MNNEPRPTLVLWADTGSGIGAGHLMRMVAIAQAWMDQGGQAVLLASQFSGQMLEPHLNGIEVRQLTGSGASISELAREVAAVVLETNAVWIAIDGYRFDESIESALAATGRPLMAMDDTGEASHAAAELVVFPHGKSLSGFADDQCWFMETRYGARWVLAGSKFVPVRREFQSGSHESPGSLPRDLFRIVVTMGGADPGNVTERVCRAIASVRSTRKLKLDVLLGPDYQHRFSLQRVLDTAGLDSGVHTQVAEPGRMFARADLVVSAGGSTLYDLACLGVPAVAVEIAANQRPVIRSMIDAGCAVTTAGEDSCLADSIAELVGEFLARPERLRHMHQAGPLAIDGRGASRIVRRMMAGRLSWRPSKWCDCQGLWRLRNDELVRANSGATETVELVEHEKWLEQVLADKNRHLFVLESEGGKIVGQCRLDIDAENASGTISVSLTEELRGCSVAGSFVAGSVRQILPSAQRAKPVRTLIAWVRPENGASRQLFASLGFISQGSGNRGIGELLEYRLLLSGKNMIDACGDDSQENCPALRPRASGAFVSAPH